MCNTQSPWIVAILLGLASWACAAPVTYDVHVNTASTVGTVGSIDFNFNPGPLNSQSASVEILAFSSDGSPAGSSSLTGSVSGTLPATLTFDNSTPFNDYFDDFTFGSVLSFKVSLSGAALNAPDGTSDSGSSFAFSMFSDAAGTIPALTNDTINGFAFIVDVNLDGSTTVSNYSAQATVVAEQAGGGVSNVPEPSSLILTSATLFLMGALRGLRRARRRLPELPLGRLEPF